MKETLVTSGPVELADLKYNQPIWIRDGRVDLVQFTGDARVDAEIQFAIKCGKCASPVERMWVAWRGSRTLAECERNYEDWRRVKLAVEFETISLLVTKAIREALDSVRIGYPVGEVDDTRTRRTVEQAERVAMRALVARGWIREPISFEMTRYPWASIRVKVDPIHSAKWMANLAQVEVRDLLQLV